MRVRLNSWDFSVYLSDSCYVSIKKWDYYSAIKDEILTHDASQNVMLKGRRWRQKTLHHSIKIISL